MNKKTKKMFALCLVVSLIMTQILFANVAFAARLSGSDRYATALEISKSWTTATTVVLASGQEDASGKESPDALAAAPYAYKLDAPILLTATGSLSAGVLARIQALGATKVVIAGGVGAVSQAVEDALKAANLTVERVAGADRYATSLEFAKKMGTVTDVALVNGHAFADALSVASIAAAKGMAILLVTKEMTANSQAMLDFIGGKYAYAIGGEGVLDVTYVANNAVRVSGADRYATNLAVIQQWAADLNFGKVYVATGLKAADALAGSVVAAKAKAPVVLAGASLAAATQTYLGTKVTSSTEVVALGGSAVVSDGVVAAVKAGVPTTMQVESVTAINARKLQVTFTKPASPDISGEGAKNPANYKINGVALNAVPYSLTSNEIKKSDDNKTFTIDLKLVNVLEHDKSYAITVENIKEQNLVNKIPMFATVLKFLDAVRPTASIVYDSAAVVKVVFSEEMNIANPSTITKVYDSNNNEVTYDAANFTIGALSDDNKSFKISMGSSVTNSMDYKVKITGAQDYVFNLVNPNPVEFIIRKNITETVKPSVSSIESIGNSKVKVTFSEALSVHGTISVAGAAALTIKTSGDDKNADVDGSGLVYTITLDGPNATAAKNGGIFTVTLANFVDMNGNLQASDSKAVNFQADTTAPAYVENRLEDMGGTKYVVVKFDDKTTFDAVAVANVVDAKFTNNDGVETTGITVTLVGNVSIYNPTGATSYDAIRINVAAFANGNGTYKVKLPTGIVTDKVGNLSKNTEITVVIGASIADSTAPKVADFTNAPTFWDAGYKVQRDAAGAASNTTMFVKFTEGLDSTSARDVNNYLISGIVAAKSVVFTDANMDTVKITLLDDIITTNGVHVFTIRGIKDKAGNAISTTNKNLTFVENVKPKVAKATLITSTQIKVEFSENMNVATVLAATDVLANADFKVKAGTDQLAVAAVDPVIQDGTSQKVYIITLAAALNADQFSKTLTLETVKDNTLRDQNGNSVAEATYTIIK